MWNLSGTFQFSIVLVNGCCGNSCSVVNRMEQNGSSKANTSEYNVDISHCTNF